MIKFCRPKNSAKKINENFFYRNQKIGDEAVGWPHTVGHHCKKQAYSVKISFFAQEPIIGHYQAIFVFCVFLVSSATYGHSEATVGNSYFGRSKPNQRGGEEKIKHENGLAVNLEEDAFNESASSSCSSCLSDTKDETRQSAPDGSLCEDSYEYAKQVNCSCHES